MISLNMEIYKLLSVIPGVTVHNEYPKTGPKLPLITYNELSNAPHASAEDLEYLSRIAFQVDCWAKDSIERTELGLKVDEALTENGYVRQMAYELADPVSGLYRKIMRFEKIV